MGQMKFYTFDETTYPGIPDHLGPETRLTNRFCDPELAAQTYQGHLNEWAICEDLGFDGALVNEHHFTYFNINPSSTVLAAALMMRTRHMRVGVIGHVLPLRHPVQTAEEFAAARRIPIARVWSPTAVFQDAFEYYKEVAQERFGWAAGPEHCIGSRYLHVAATTEQSIAECRDAVMYVRRLTTFSRPVQVPAAVPGIQTDRSFDYRTGERAPARPECRRVFL
jgi:Luciferase-like monooxygenase